jgi:hypothetical protein
MIRLYVFLCYLLVIVAGCQHPSFVSPPQEWRSLSKKECPSMCLYQSRDSAVFYFVEGTLLTSGMDTIKPLSFKIYLPPGIISYRSLNSKNFEFFYKNDRAVVIRNSYDPSKKVISQRAELVTLAKENISEWSPLGLSNDLDVLLDKHKSRVTRAYSKGDILLGLVNLQEKEVDNFERFIATIKIID